MKRCTKCRALHSDKRQQYCTQDGGLLEPDFNAAQLQQTLGEKYLLTHLIGQGSMGAVYRALHRDLGDVAIKVMLDTKYKSQFSERFLREAKALRQLRHPNTVIIFDLERSETGVTYMVMEYVAGSSIRQELDKRIPQTMPLADVVIIAEAVCEALQEAHEHKIVHRDVKPDNILIAEKQLLDGATQRTIKLVDFGIVKVPDTPNDVRRQLTITGTYVGTPYYMAPEQWLGDGTGLYALDGRADLYALGGTLYEMLAGHKVFHQAMSAKELKQFHLTEDPPPLHQVAPQVPELVSQVIMRMLAKERGDRYLTAKACGKALREAYTRSSPSTEQLNQERLEHAARLWGRSDAPVNEQQLAPTINPMLNQNAPSVKDLSDSAQKLKAALLSDIAPTPLPTPTADDTPLLTDSPKRPLVPALAIPPVQVPSWIPIQAQSLARPEIAQVPALVKSELSATDDDTLTASSLAGLSEQEFAEADTIRPPKPEHEKTPVPSVNGGLLPAVAEKRLSVDPADHLTLPLPALVRPVPVLSDVAEVELDDEVTQEAQIIDLPPETLTTALPLATLQIVAPLTAALQPPAKEPVDDVSPSAEENLAPPVHADLEPVSASESDLVEIPAPSVIESEATPASVAQENVPAPPPKDEAAASLASVPAPPATPPPPKLGDTFMGLNPRQTQKLDNLSTHQVHLPEATGTPLKLPLIYPTPLPETRRPLTSEAAAQPVAAPPEQEAVPATSDAPVTAPEVTLKPVTPMRPDRQEKTYENVWPAYNEPAPPPIAETLPPAKPITPPAPRPRWHKAAIGGGAALLLLLMGVAVYQLRPAPPKPNDNLTDDPRLQNVNLPMAGFLQVAAPPSSGVFVDDERKATVQENGLASLQLLPGVYDLRVTLIRGDDLQIFRQVLEVKANQTLKVVPDFVRRPPLAGEPSRTQAEALASNGKYLEAEAQYLRYLQNSPADTDARAGLAAVLAQQGRYTEAIERQEAVAGFREKDIETQRTLARFYALKKDEQNSKEGTNDAKAADILRAAQKMASRNDIRLLVDLANLRARSPEGLEEALRVSEKALLLQPNDPTALDARARVLIEQGSAKEAAEFAAKAVAKAPRELAWQATLAVALLRSSDKDKPENTAEALAKYRQLRDADKKGEWRNAPTVARLRFYGPKFLESLTGLQMQTR